jgi:hypothetical protein
MYDAATNGSATVPLPVNVATVPFDSFVRDGPGIAGVTLEDADEYEPVPTLFNAATRNV